MGDGADGELLGEEGGVGVWGEGVGVEVGEEGGGGGHGISWEGVFWVDGMECWMGEW